MKTRFFKLFLLFFAISAAVPSFACTSAIFSGKATPDGRPLLWKHRDTGELNNRIEYYPVSAENKYSFIGLGNSEKCKGEIWAGTNSEGFSIMNTASYNLQEKKAPKEDMEGVVMCKALGCCKNLADFEKMLDKMVKPLGVEANFGVIDAQGGAAYYEVNNYEWRKVDINDPKIAPEGYLVYTNHSYTGRINDGSGYIRYATASSVTLKQWIKGEAFTPQWIFNNLSRSFYNAMLDLDLKKTPEATPSGWFPDTDFIPRRSTSASIVVKGVKPGEDPSLTVMWTVLGYPPCGVAVPLFAVAGADQPAVMMKGQNTEKCEMCSQALERRANVFSNRRANAKNYLNYKVAAQYIEKLAPVEESNFKACEKFMNEKYASGKISAAEAKNFYNSLVFGENIK